MTYYIVTRYAPDADLPDVLEGELVPSFPPFTIKVPDVRL
jgi:hypothetical protein